MSDPAKLEWQVDWVRRAEIAEHEVLMLRAQVKILQETIVLLCKQQLKPMKPDDYTRSYGVELSDQLGPSSPTDT